MNSAYNPIAPDWFLSSAEKKQSFGEFLSEYHRRKKEFEILRPVHHKPFRIENQPNKTGYRFVQLQGRILRKLRIPVRFQN